MERRGESAAETASSRADLAVLVNRAQIGDPDAFEELVRRTYADTYTLAFRLTGDVEDARDVVQETYLRVHKGLARFRGDSQFTTWLYRVTANCASTFLGRRGNQRHDPLPEDGSVIDDDVHADPDSGIETGHLRSQLTDALRGLPPKLRAVVVLRDVYDLPHEAIAEELGISVSAAKVRLHRARKRLRERLSATRADGDRRWGKEETSSPSPNAASTPPEETEA